MMHVWNGVLAYNAAIVNKQSVQLREADWPVNVLRIDKGSLARR